MNCGKSRREECSEECAGGNTEEELEEYCEIFENLEDYRNDAKKNRPKGKNEVSDSDDDSDEDSDDETDSDDDKKSNSDSDDDDDDEESDSDDDDDDEESDSDNDEEEEEEKEESGTLKTLQNKAKNLLSAKRSTEKSKKSKHHK